ncbi:MAG: hypothetical protein WC588_03665 [Candidatus Micrarchaeia archaeon]
MAGEIRKLKEVVDLQNPYERSCPHSRPVFAVEIKGEGGTRVLLRSECTGGNRVFCSAKSGNSCLSDSIITNRRK